MLFHKFYTRHRPAFNGPAVKRGRDPYSTVSERSYSKAPVSAPESGYWRGWEHQEDAWVIRADMTCLGSILVTHRSLPSQTNGLEAIRSFFFLSFFFFFFFFYLFSFLLTFSYSVHDLPDIWFPLASLGRKSLSSYIWAFNFLLWEHNDGIGWVRPHFLGHHTGSKECKLVTVMCVLCEWREQG